MTEGNRLHALDAIRGFALLAGVGLHAAMSFLPGFEKSGIPIVDNSPSLLLAILFFVIHMFRMTLFFVIAGFFARMLLERDGTAAFVRNRFFRIAMPLFVFWFIVLPPMIVAMVWGAYKKYGGVMPGNFESDAQYGQPAFPLTHLWFLYVLLWLYAGFLCVRWMMDRLFDPSRRLRAFADSVLQRLVQSRYLIYLLAVPTCANLMLLPAWIAWFGIPTPDQSLIPNLSATIAFTTAFGLGWFVERRRELLALWQRDWIWHLVVAVASTIGCFAIAGASPRYLPLTVDWQVAGYAILYCVGVWSWTFAVFGVALLIHSKPHPVTRYLADSSYWVYLLHMPLVFLLQVMLQDLPLHWTIKFPIVFGVTMLLLIISYHWLVRSTFIGKWLNGRSYPRTSLQSVMCPITTGEGSACDTGPRNAPLPGQLAIGDDREA